MMKRYTMIAILTGIAQLHFAETNAVIEVKLFKDWAIEGERVFGNLAIKNTGTSPILLAKDTDSFDTGQLYFARLDNREEAYRQIAKTNFFGLLPGETHVYEGRKLYFWIPDFSEEMRFTVSIYLGYEPSTDRAVRRLPIEVQRKQYSVKEFWLDSEPLMVKGVVPDSEEYLATVIDNLTYSKLASERKRGFGIFDLVAVTYKNERWLYTKSTDSHHIYPICPLSLTNKIHIEDHEGENLFKIWDGDKSMILHFTKSILLEGPDENNVLGKWTRERKQKAEADNAEVRRKKAEQQ